MSKHSRGSWTGLYALLPIAIGLLYVVGAARVAETVRELLLVAVVFVVVLLALFWAETHPDLLGSEGVDAWAEEDSLSAAGIKTGRFAPSLTGRQANYRRVMLVHRTDEPLDRTE